jgi:AcrR family transcriptional regulator
VSGQSSSGSDTMAGDKTPEQPPTPSHTDLPGTGSAPDQRVPLTRQRVLATALRLVDTEGLDALTRRRLARELGRDAMTLYRYAPDQAALLDGIVELVLDELELPEEGQDWQTQLRRSAHSFRLLALAHPHVVNLLLTRPVATAYGLRPPATLRPLEHFLELLTTAGFPAAGAMRIHRAFVGFLCGHLLAELQDTVVNPDETDDLLRLGLHQLPPRQFPILRSLASELAHYDGTRELDHGLDLLLAGITTHHPTPGDAAALA